MHDLLFQNQTHLKLKDLHHYAEKLELDLVRFDFELSDQVYRQRVNEHVDSGNAAACAACRPSSSTARSWMFRSGSITCTTRFTRS